MASICFYCHNNDNDVKYIRNNSYICATVVDQSEE